MLIIFGVSRIADSIGTVHTTREKDSHAGCPFLFSGAVRLLQAGHGGVHLMAEAGQEVLGGELLRMGMQTLGIEIPFALFEAVQGIGPPRSRWPRRVRKR